MTANKRPGFRALCYIHSILSIGLRIAKGKAIRRSNEKPPAATGGFSQKEKVMKKLVYILANSYDDNVNSA